MTTLLKQKTCSWPKEAQDVFQALRQAMCSIPALSLLDFSLPFEIETYACDKGVGVVLTQNGHPVALFSKALSAANQRLFTCEKEFLVVLMSIDKWIPDVLRQHFVVKTDHKSLCHLQDQSLSTEI
jgi:hypothetical protein